MLRIEHYIPMILWLVVLIVSVASNFASNVGNKRKNFIVYSFLLVIILAIAGFFNQMLESDFLNLLAYVILAHILVFFMYFICFPSYHKHIRGSPYEMIFMSLVLAGAIGVFISLTLIDSL